MAKESGRPVYGRVVVPPFGDAWLYTSRQGRIRPRRSAGFRRQDERECPSASGRVNRILVFCSLFRTPAFWSTRRWFRAEARIESCNEIS